METMKISGVPPEEAPTGFEVDHRATPRFTDSVIEQAVEQDFDAFKIEYNTAITQTEYWQFNGPGSPRGESSRHVLGKLGMLHFLDDVGHNIPLQRDDRDWTTIRARIDEDELQDKIYSKEVVECWRDGFRADVLCECSPIDVIGEIGTVSRQKLAGVMKRYRLDESILLTAPYKRMKLRDVGGRKSEFTFYGYAKKHIDWSRAIFPNSGDSGV